MATMAQQAVSIPVPVGVVKSFGEYGPQYQVLSYAGKSGKGDDMVRIRVYPSLEETDYRYAAMMADPEVV
jgi:hypothetical protein